MNRRPVLLQKQRNSRRFDEAVSAISHVTLGDREPFLQELKCEWLERIGRYADAAAVCSHLTNLRPDDKHLRMRLAELTLRSGNFAEAKGMFDLPQPRLMIAACFYRLLRFAVRC